jgi:hypothetical protein
MFVGRLPVSSLTAVGTPNSYVGYRIKHFLIDVLVDGNEEQAVAFAYPWAVGSNAIQPDLR